MCGSGGIGGGSSPGEMALGLSFACEEKSHMMVCKNGMDNGCGCALLIIKSCINVRDCHILKKVLLFLNLG